MRRKAIVLCLLFTFIAFIATPSQAWLFSLSNKGEDLVDIFEAIETGGATEQNVSRLEAYVRNNASEPNADEALLELARIYSRRKEYGKATEAFQKLLLDFPASRYKNDALYDLGNVMYRTGRLSDARSVLDPVSVDASAPADLRARASLLLKEIKDASNGVEPDSEAAAVGVLLPLKGDYARFGEAALEGILLAANTFSPGGGTPMDVIVRDVSDPSKVERAVDDLSTNSRVAAIIGPLVSSTAVEAARDAQQRSIPIVTLTQKDGITGTGDFVFRNFLTPSAQAAAVADYATIVGKKKFAILYPQNNYGSELARYFEKEVQRRGGETVRAASYQPGATNFGELIKRLFGIEVQEKSEGRRHIREFTSTAEIDALFIPDYAETVGLIAPYLEYYNIKDVQLLGANGWNSQSLVTLGGKNVEGAVFVDGFFPAGNRPGTQDFVRRFNDTYARSPGVLEAEAYDAAASVAEALKDVKMRPDRDAVRNSLLRNRSVEGAEGSISFDSQGEAVKRLFLLTVRNGRIIEVPEEEIVPPPPAPAPDTPGAAQPGQIAPAGDAAP